MKDSVAYYHGQSKLYFSRNITFDSHLKREGLEDRPAGSVGQVVGGANMLDFKGVVSEAM